MLLPSKVQHHKMKPSLRVNLQEVKNWYFLDFTRAPRQTEKVTQIVYRS